MNIIKRYSSRGNENRDVNQICTVLIVLLQCSILFVTYEALKIILEKSNGVTQFPLNGYGIISFLYSRYKDHL